MIAQMASTNMDKSKIDLAGVVSGAKMLVRPVEEGSAAATLIKHHNKYPMIRSTPKGIDLFLRRICVDRSLYLCVFERLEVCFQPPSATQLELPTLQYAGLTARTHHAIEGILHSPFGVCAEAMLNSVSRPKS